MAQYTDSIDKLWDLQELKKEHDLALALVNNWLAEVTKASKKMREMQFSLVGADMSTMKANAKEVETLTNQQIKSIKALADAKLKEAKAEEALSRARLNAAKLQANQDKENLALQKDLEKQAKANTKALQEFAKQQGKAAINAAKEANAYEQLKKKYREAANEAKRLGAELGADSAKFKEAAASAHAMHAELLKIEMAVGQAQRQVGNYNVVGAQFQQLLRELPNAGISARTFVMAISNNVSYFAEAVKDARAQGQSWGAILKTLGGSLFSLVGVLNIALTVFAYFALNSSKAADSAQTLTEKIDDLTDSTLNYIKAANEQNRLINDAFNQGSRAQQRYIDLLVSQGATEEVLGRERKKLHQIRIAEFNQQIAKYDEVEKAVMKFAKAVRGGDPSKISTTRGELDSILGTLGLSAEEAEKQRGKIMKVAVEMQHEGKQMSLDNFEFLQGIMDERIRLEESVKDELNAIETNKYNTEREIRDRNKRDYEKYLKDQEKARKEAFERIRQQNKEKGDILLLPTSEQIRAEIKQLENEKLANELQQAIFGNEQFEKQALTEIERQYSQGLISAEQYEAGKLKIQNDYAVERIKLEIETTKKLLANGGLGEDERLKLISRLNDLELDLAKQGNDKKLKEEEEYKKASLKLEEERASRIRQIRQELTNAAVQFANFVIEREREQLNDKKQRLDDERQVEIARIEATSATDEEAARRKFALEQRSLAQKQQIQKKEEQLERNRFLLEQAAALARVAINANEAVGKITAQAAVLSSNPITAALAAQAYAQIPIVYGSAAVQAGLIAAQVLAYAEGTPEGGHKGGSALVGEAGEPEYVKEPGKAGYWVDKPTYFKNMPAGTEVLPLHKLEAQGIGRLDSMALNAIMLQGGGNTAKTEALLSEAVDKLGKIERKPSSQMVIKGNSFQEIITVGGNKRKKLDKNFLD